MNFTALKYFTEVAADGNITRTAQRLHMSQQSLSAQVKKLEEELGVSLFSRSPAFRLTYAGSRLLQLSQGILSLQEEIYRETEDISGGKRSLLRIGISYTCGHALLPHLLPDYLRSHPLTEVRLSEGNTDELERLLLQGELDYIIAFSPVHLTGAECRTICPEQLYLVLPRELCQAVFSPEELPALRSGAVQPELQRLKDSPFILLKEGNRARTGVNNYLMHRSFRPNILLETENSETALALAQAGLGVVFYSGLFLNTIHPELLVPSPEHQVEVFPLSAPETSGELVIARMPRPYHTRAEEDFLAHCMQVMNA